MRLAHVSDLHFGEEAPGAAMQLLADLHAAAPAAIAVTGDLTRRARAVEFAAARAFLADLPAPWLVIPGNHDIPQVDIVDRMLDPLGRWRMRGLPADFPTVLRIDGLRLVGIDSVARAQWHADWSAGAIGSGRRAALAACLSAEPGETLVCCHHPLLHAPDSAGRRAPRGGVETAALLARAGVPLVLSGHLHRTASYPLLAGGPRQVIAPSALSPRGGGTGWLLLEREAHAWRITERRWIGTGWVARTLPAVR